MSKDTIRTWIFRCKDFNTWRYSDIYNSSNIIFYKSKDPMAFNYDFYYAIADNPKCAILYINNKDKTIKELAIDILSDQIKIVK